MADLLDVLSISEARRAIKAKADNTDLDADLARHVTAISRLLDDKCGPVVQRTVTAEYHDGGRATITLHRRPVASIILVREAAGDTVTTLTESAFGTVTDGYLAPRHASNPALLSGQLIRRYYGGPYSWEFGTSAVEVTYVAGRYATTAAVDARFKDAAGAVLRRLWKREAGAWAQSSSYFEGADDNASTGFFRVAVPIIDEMLFEEIQRELIVA